MSELLTKLLGHQAAFAGFAAAIWATLSTTAGAILHPDRKVLFARWLKGDFDEPFANVSWITHFINAFETVFSDRPFSIRFFVRSAVASMLFVVTLYLIFLVTGLLGSDKGRAGDLTLIQMILFGLSINIVADYVSLIETRWLLNRFKSQSRYFQHILLLLLDLILTAIIIYCSIWVFTTGTDRVTVHPFELINAFSPLSIFFYSTFLTSFWSWAYFLTVWFMRFFCRTPLRNNWLDIESRPFLITSIVGSFLTFLCVLPFSWFLTPEPDSRITAWDRITCEWSDKICDDLIRISQSEKDRALSCKFNTEICVKESIEYYSGDVEKASHLFRALCNEGKTLGCSNLGLLFEQGTGVTADATEAARLYTRACDGYAMMACNNLGLLYLKGNGVREDASEAFRLFSQSCDGDYMIGCNNLGTLYQNGQGVSTDYSKASHLYTLACNRDLAYGCSNLGFLYDEGKGVATDQGEAFRLYTLACDRGDGQGCNNLANFHLNGTIVKKDARATARLYTQACDGGYMLGCYNLGALYANGTGVTQNTDKAIQLATRACNEGQVKAACDRIQKITADSQ